MKTLKSSKVSWKSVFHMLLVGGTRHYCSQDKKYYLNKIGMWELLMHSDLAIPAK